MRTELQRLLDLYGLDSGDMSNSLLQMVQLGDVEAEGPMIITRAEGNYFWDGEGRKFFDGLSGLINVQVGFGRHELADVAAETMKRLSFGHNFFGRTTVEALALTKKLAELTPESINRFFLSVTGSDSMDTAVKLIRHTNVLSGKPEKMTVISRVDSYHGMTLGSTFVTGQPVLREHVGPMMAGIAQVSGPARDAGPESTAILVQELEHTILSIGPDKVAAFIGEPIALPPGVAIPPNDYWPAISAICRKYDIRLVLDEVVTGFGRTGTMFACEHWGIQPDVMTMSKGITSGYQALGAVGFSEEIYQILLNSEMILPHGFTTGGHPVACAVALRNIEIIQQEGLLENTRQMGGYVHEKLLAMQQVHPSVLRVRNLGLLGAFDLDGDMLAGEGNYGETGRLMTRLLREAGLVLRPYGDSMAFGPALMISAKEVDDMFARFDTALTGLEQRLLTGLAGSRQADLV